MTSNGAAEAAATLRDLASLEEAILTEMRTDKFGYTVRLFLTLPVGAACAGDHERRVRIDLDGVHPHRVQIVSLDDDPRENDPAAAVPRPDAR
jgi:hypothetical protein